MGRVAVFVMAVIVPVIISANGRYGGDQPNFGLVKFIPPDPGCVVTLVFDPTADCKWCDTLYRHLDAVLVENYIPMITRSLRGPKDKKTLTKWESPPDMKGNCFVNWFMAENYNQLSTIFSPSELSELRSNDWFIFIENQQRQRFMDSWKSIIDFNYGQVFPRVVLSIFDPEQAFRQQDIPITEFERNSRKLEPSMDFVRSFFDPEHLFTGDNKAKSNNGVEELNKPVLSTAVSCYMCPESESYFIQNENTEATNPWTLLQNAVDKKGNTALTYSYEEEYFTAWTPDLVNDIDDFAWYYVNQIALNQINYSDGINQTVGLKYYFVLSVNEGEANIIKQLQFSRVKTVVLSKEAKSFVYCRAQYYSLKHFTALASPFDAATWTLLLTILAAVWLLSRLCFWVALDLFWMTLAQPPQHGKNIGFLILSLAILLLPIQMTYKEFFSSNSMAPFQTKPIEKNQELFDSGFRIICQAGNASSCALEDFAGLKKKELKLNMSAAEKYYMGAEELETTTPEQILSLAKDKGAALYEREEKEIILHQQEGPNTKCYMVEEYWSVEVISVQFTGPLSQVFYDTLRRLREVGIVDYWYKIPRVTKLRKLKENLASDDDHPQEVTYMEGTLRSVIELFMAMMIINILLLAAEISSVKVAARWQRWRERRRYLRAIYPLGRI